MASTISCIDENKIGALFDHRLSTTEIEEIDEHVAGCDDCRDLLSSMARLYASSSPSRVLVQTAALLNTRRNAGSTAPLAAPQPTDSDEASIKRLLMLLGCERQVGRVLGNKWRLDAVLGLGGMAEVYAATHLSNGRRAAIKMLRREWLSRPNVVRRFLREGYVANRVSHPGAVTILDEGTADDGTPFLVLELLDGRTIGSHVRDRLPTSTVLWIASEILDVLAAAHDKHVVHRDIKPENVFLTRHGSVKLLDFGIARMRDLTGEVTQAGGSTQQGMLMGTLAYMPPEQAGGKLDQIDARTDVWAVGATMFALLSGRTVHTGTPSEMLASAMGKAAPKLATVAPTIDPEICEIVDRALAFAREERWQGAREMQSAIRQTRERIGDVAIGKLPRPFESRPLMPVFGEGESQRKRRLTSAVLVMAATVLSIAMTIGFLARQRATHRAEIARSAMDVTLASPAPLLSAKAVMETPTNPPPIVNVSTEAPRLQMETKRSKPFRRPSPRRAEP